MLPSRSFKATYRKYSPYLAIVPHRNRYRIAHIPSVPHRNRYRIARKINFSNSEHSESTLVNITQWTPASNPAANFTMFLLAALLVSAAHVGAAAPHIGFSFDVSGSFFMMPAVEQEYVDMVKLLQGDSIGATAHATAVQFASSASVLYRNTAVADLPLTAPFKAVSGLTALYDGLAATIDAVDSSSSSSSSGQCTIIWLMSNGGEKDSKKMSQNDIQRLVSAKRKAGWKFMYAWEYSGAGASGSVQLAASKLGFDPRLTVLFSDNARTAVMEVVANKAKAMWASGCPESDSETTFTEFSAKERAMVAIGLPPSVSTDAIYARTLQLVDAVLNNDVSNIRKAASAGAWMQALADGVNLVSYAALNGHVGAVTALLEAGAEIATLHNAASEGNVDAIKILVNAGADVEAKDKFRETALHTAAINGHVAVIHALAKFRANLDAKDDKYGSTALHSAAISGKVDVIYALADSGADIHAKDKSGDTAIELARVAQGENSDAVAALKVAARLAFLDFRATLHAYYSKHSVEQLDKVDAIAVKYKSKSKKAKLFRLLEEKYGAEVVPILATEATAKDAKQPVAVAKKDAAAAQKRAATKAADAERLKLERAAADEIIAETAALAEQRRASKAAAALAAVAEKQKARELAAEQFQQFRATLHAYYSKHSVEQLGKVDAIAVKYTSKKAKLFRLLEEKYGAEVVPIEATAEDARAARSRSRPAKQLKKVAVAKKDEQFCNSADLEDKDELGNTALRTAAYNGNVDGIKALLEGGADVYAKDKSGDTALYLAALYGHVDAVTALNAAATNPAAKAARDALKLTRQTGGS